MCSSDLFPSHDRGRDGINEASAVDVSDGTLSMDALNLSQKVYNFLNRIAVSGGTYRDWLETVYTGGNYMERCETPTFEGGVSQEIVFQEVVSNSASQDEPLGTLAGRGVTTGRQKGGHIRIKVTEPCYICVSVQSLHESTTDKVIHGILIWKLWTIGTNQHWTESDTKIR